MVTTSPMTTSPTPRPSPASMWTILLCAGAIVTLSMGIRHGFGLWLQPMTQAMNWSRETFSMALALQNLCWGVVGIGVGMVADRFGAFRVLTTGAVLYALGLVGMAWSHTPLQLALTTGLVIGCAQASTTYAVVYGVLGRRISADKRSWAMGVVAAAGSFGQFLMVPIEGLLIDSQGWDHALYAIALMALLMAPLAWGLRERAVPASIAPTTGPAPHLPPTAAWSQTIGQALSEALRYPSFLMLTAGYFVCGFQLAFIGVHMPSYLKDQGLPAQVASYSLALIGLFNIVGTYTAGALGQRMAKRGLLATIYLCRAVAIALFVTTTPSAWSVYCFAAVMGFFWLSTVPLTNATVANIFGVQHLSMLSGLVFFSHQVGSFMGVWLGGYLYDSTGSYALVWQLSIGLSVLAALVNLPVREAAISRPQRAGAAHASLA